MAMLDYRIDVQEPAARELAITLHIDRELVIAAPVGSSPASHVDLFLPTWTPGSYLIREYARHLSRVEATDAASGAALRCVKTAKNRFRIQLGAATWRLRVTYRVYAHELSVRTADMTAEHAYWNHACALLWPLGRPELSARLTVVFPRAWDLACALPEIEPATAAGIPAGAIARTLFAEDMARAFDSPCLVGRFQRVEWQVDGVPHVAALDGLAGVPPPPGFVADLTAIIERTRDVFGGDLPYSRYSFLCLFAADGHGGLEHGDSTTLLASRAAFASEKGYHEFLSLAAHELFHAWNVKRLRPVELWSYDYEHENYTEFLWLIEGWTAYYDDLLCLRAGIVARADYLALAAKNVNAMLAAPGRLRLSLRESSFDAWIRLYRPDENTRNSSQNYYGNGAVAAMCLDLTLRRATAGAGCLDDVARNLYRATFAAGRGYTLDDVQRAVASVGGASAVAALSALVDDKLDPDLGALLASFGIRMQAREADRPFLGVQFDNGSMRVGAVTAGSPAHAAGMQPGDEVVAVADLRVDSGRWQEVFQAIAKIDTPIELLIARRGVVTRCVAVPSRSPGTIHLEVDETASAEARELRDGWLPPKATKNEPISAGAAH